MAGATLASGQVHLGTQEEALGEARDVLCLVSYTCPADGNEGKSVCILVLRTAETIPGSSVSLHF